MSLLERFLTVSGSSARLLRNQPPPARMPETQEYVDARVEARDLCRNLGLDVANEHWDGASVADFVRLAYAQGWKACESRIYGPDIADAIAVAIKTPGEIVTEGGGGALSWQVAAVQRAVVYGVPS